VIASEIKNAILEIGINKCARESGFDRKNFIRKLVRGWPTILRPILTAAPWRLKHPREPTKMPPVCGLMERAYRNLGYILTVLLPIFIAGFWVPYLSEIPHFEQSITAAVHIHAVLLFCFLILLIVQPLAIRYNAFSTHRILGRLSNIIVPFALVFSIAMLWKEYHEHLIGGATVRLARNAEFLSATQLLLFGTLYGASIAAIRRRDVATHMRCMICIALVLLPAGLARILVLVRRSAIVVADCLPCIDRRFPACLSSVRWAQPLESPSLLSGPLGVHRD
jgi:hypothetical protein